MLTASSKEDTTGTSKSDGRTTPGPISSLHKPNEDTDMANQGIMHLASRQGGKPYCNSRRAIMSTTPDRIKPDGWVRICAKCEAVRLRYEQGSASK